MAIRVFVADDHEIVRHGLKALLAQAGPFEVVGEASCGPDTLSGLAGAGADVLILDISMPGGVPAAKVIQGALSSNPELAIVILTMHEDEYYLREMFQAGARGFVLKKSATDNLAEAIRTTFRGGHFVDPAMAGLMVPAFLGGPTRRLPSQCERLTPREREVCKLLALGHTSAEIGEQLHISPRTVESHRSNIMKRLGLRSRADLVRYAIDQGLMSLS